jgi:hypothetical protein
MSIPNLQKGGVLFYHGSLDENGNPLKNSQEAFDFFMNHSVKEHLAFGANGIVLKCTFSPENKTLISPYVAFHNINFAERVNVIIVKFVLIKDRNSSFSYQKNGKKDVRSINTMSMSTFERETQMYTSIVQDTNMLLEPKSPTILYCELIPKGKGEGEDGVFPNMVNTITNSLIDSSNKSKIMIKDGRFALDKNGRKIYDDRKKPILEFKDKPDSNIGLEIKNLDCDIGVIAMESAGINDDITELHTALDTAIKKNEYQKIHQLRAIAALELMYLATHGYIHGDHHGGNMVVSEKYKYYFYSSTNPWANTWKLSIYDFARSFKMTQDKHQEFLVKYLKFINYQSNNAEQIHLLRDCLTFIYNQGFYSIYTSTKVHFGGDVYDMYGWIINNNIINQSVTIFVQQLHYARRNAMKLTIARVERLIANIENVSNRASKSVPADDIIELPERGETWSEEFMTKLLKLKESAESSREKILLINDNAEVIAIKEMEDEKARLIEERRKENEDKIARRQEEKAKQDAERETKKQEEAKLWKEREPFIAGMCFVGLLSVIAVVLNNAPVHGGDHSTSKRMRLESGIRIKDLGNDRYSITYAPSENASVNERVRDIFTNFNSAKRKASSSLSQNASVNKRDRDIFTTNSAKRHKLYSVKRKASSLLSQNGSTKKFKPPTPTINNWFGDIMPSESKVPIKKSMMHTEYPNQDDVPSDTEDIEITDVTNIYDVDISDVPSSDKDIKEIIDVFISAVISMTNGILSVESLGHPIKLSSHDRKRAGSRGGKAKSNRSRKSRKSKRAIDKTKKYIANPI